MVAKAAALRLPHSSEKTCSSVQSITSEICLLDNEGSEGIQDYKSALD